MKHSGKADWWQLHISCTQANHDAVLDTWLQDLGASSITLSDAQDEPIYLCQPDEETLWHTIHITALLDTEPSAELTRQLNDFQSKKIITAWHTEALQDQDWQHNYRSHCRATKHGQRLWVYPQWDPPPADADGDAQVQIDPGLAFGSGTHPTTALCLTWLEQHITPQSIVVDYGCGSGILAIAAIKLGAEKVYAIDHDPQAMLSTEQNACQNNVSKPISIHHSDSPPPIEADIVIANILANPLIMLTETLAAHTKKGGVCVLSGILKHQINQLEPHYKQHFQALEITTQEDWACWSLRKI